MTGVTALMTSYGGSSLPTLVYDLDAATYTGLSASFNGTSQDLSVPANAGFDFGTGDFTIECWINATQLKLADVYVQIPGGSAYIFFGLANVSGAMRFNNNNGASYSPFGTVNTANSLISINTWYHVALMRSGNTLSLFINGVCRGTKSGVSADAMGGSSDPVKIAGENRFPGRISNMRVVKGSTVYTYGTTVGTTYFTPPTTPLTAVAGTQLLLPLTTTPFTDISTNTLTVTNTGTVASIVLSPFTSTDATGTYPITVVNPTPRISWNSANGGVFRVTTASTNNFMTFGPDFSSSTQAFTVGMAYKWNGATAGRLLNANTGSPDFLMGLWGSGTCRMNIAFAGTFIGSSSDAADTAWHFIWFTCTGTVSATRSKSYIATNTQPTTTYGTGADNGGFNGLRLFGRFVNSTTSSEEVDADVGFVKVWNGELSLAQIQAQYAAYKTRFGY